MNSNTHTISQWLGFIIGLAVIFSLITRGFSGTSQCVVYLLLIVIFIFDDLYNKKQLLNKNIFYAILFGLGTLYLYLLSNSAVFYNTLFGFYYIVSFIIIVYLVSQRIKNNSWNIVLLLIYFAFQLNIVLTLLQIFILNDIPKGFFESKNSNAAFISLISLYSFLGCLREYAYLKKSIFAISLCGIFISYFIIFLIASRGIFIANTIGLILILCYLFKVKTKSKSVWIITVIFAAYFISGLTNEWHSNKKIDEMLDAYFLIQQGNSSDKYKSSLGQRLLIWKTIAQMLEETSIMGSGYFSFHMRYPAYQNREERSSGQYAHNDYLQVWVEQGYLGLLLMLIFVFWIIYHIINLLNNAKDESEQECEQLLILASLFSVLIHSLVSYNFYIMPIMIVFMIFLGRFLQLNNRKFIKQYAPKAAISNLHRINILAFFFIMTLPLCAILLMNHYYKQATSAYQAGDVANAEKNLLKSEKWFDTENIHLYKALLYLQIIEKNTNSDIKHYIDWGLQEINQAEKLNPYLADVNYYRGLFYRFMKNETKAISEFKQALLKNHRHYRSRLELATIAEQLEGFDSARMILESGLSYAFPKEIGIRKYLEKLIYYRKNTGDFSSADALSNRLDKLNKGFN